MASFPAVIAGLFPVEWLHPGGSGYWMYSGIFGGSAFLSGIAAFGGIWWRKHNCHVQGCPRLQWHTHPGHGHPVCVKHHPFGQGRGAHLHASEHDLDHHATFLSPLSYTQTATSHGPYGTSVLTTTSGEAEVSVGAPEPEKPRRARKPGRGPITDISSKRP